MQYEWRWTMERSSSRHAVDDRVHGLVATVRPNPSVHAAERARFDHVYITSSPFLNRGGEGVLVMDKRNGNVWFISRVNNASQVVFNDPVFVTRIPFELNAAP